MPRVSTFKHDNNVCACAVSALILLPVVNLSLEFSDIDFLYYVEIVAVRRCFWPILAIFHNGIRMYNSESDRIAI